jgi:hypothetical protein
MAEPNLVDEETVLRVVQSWPRDRQLSVRPLDQAATPWILLLIFDHLFRLLAWSPCRTSPSALR